MPWKLEKVDGGWVVVNSDTGKRKSAKPRPRKRALAYLRALYANYHPDKAK